MLRMQTTMNVTQICNLSFAARQHTQPPCRYYASFKLTKQVKKKISSLIYIYIYIILEFYIIFSRNIFPDNFLTVLFETVSNSLLYNAN